MIFKVNCHIYALYNHGGIYNSHALIFFKKSNLIDSTTSHNTFSSSLRGYNCDIEDTEVQFPDTCNTLCVGVNLWSGVGWLGIMLSGARSDAS